MSTCTCPGPLYPGIHECPDRDDPITAAARAWHARQQAGRMDVGRDRGDGRPAQWDDLTETDRRAARAFVRPLVDAALRAAGVAVVIVGTDPETWRAADRMIDDAQGADS